MVEDFANKYERVFEATSAVEEKKETPHDRTDLGHFTCTSGFTYALAKTSNGALWLQRGP